MRPHAYRRCGRRCSALLAGAGLAALVLASAAGAAAPEANEWPVWRGPDGTGISAETGWRADWSAEPPKTLWKVKVGQGFSAVSVAGGRLYTMGNTEGTDTVWCLNPDSGEVIWKHSYPCKPHDHPGPRCTPTVDGDVVYTLSNRGDLFCLEAATGKVKWEVKVPQAFGAEPPQWGFACSPLVLGKMLVLDVGPTVALDKATGKEIWKSGSDKAGYGSPYAFQMGGETLIATFPEFGPRVVKAADGKELGRVRWKTAWGVNAVTPIVEGNTMFISSGYNVGAALFEVSANGLKALWKNKNMRNHANNCVLWKGYLYGFDGQVNEGRLTCIEYKTGEKKWSEGSLKAGGLMMVDGKLVLMASSGECAVVEASPDACKILGRTKILEGTCWTQPVLVGGRIYCRNHPGDLVCLDVRAK
ncbi:MAG TPA: PQQ-binding-like beta-propeller repeat protein [Phycisphaerae bacterium]|nr:PQQ-binding-like beta-propeller repeat protein [Phycisphaerae bacterium]